MTEQNGPQRNGEDARPRPAFGEYAPEGWEWKPEGEDAAVQPGAPASPESAQRGSGSARPANVPHNLGVSTPPAGAPAPGTAPSGGNSPGSDAPGPAPYRAAPPKQQYRGPSYGAPGAYGAQGQRPRTGDRVATILLLVLGAIGALMLTQGMFALGSSFNTIGVLLDIEDFTAPAWVSTLGTVSGFVLLALYATVLLYSLQRMRAGRLTFWVPLVAGIVAIIGVFIVMMVATNAMPELVERLSDPAAMQELYDNLLSATGSASL